MPRAKPPQSGQSRTVTVPRRLPSKEIKKVLEILKPSMNDERAAKLVAELSFLIGISYAPPAPTNKSVMAGIQKIIKAAEQLRALLDIEDNDSQMICAAVETGLEQFNLTPAQTNCLPENVLSLIAERARNQLGYYQKGMLETLREKPRIALAYTLASRWKYWTGVWPSVTFNDADNSRNQASPYLYLIQWCVLYKEGRNITLGAARASARSSGNYKARHSAKAITGT